MSSGQSQSPPQSPGPRDPNCRRSASTASPGWSFSWLFAPVDIAMLVYFRIAFGITAVSWVVTSILKGSVDELFVAPRLHFHYPGLSAIQPLSGDGMHWLFFALSAAATLILVGLCYRVAATTFAIGFTYLFLLDKACYQNHYYLLCLVSWIMVVVPANRAGSLDAWLRPSIRRAEVPCWSLGLLRFQIAIPYFYGGIAKINADWLRGQPIRAVLEYRGSETLAGPLLTHPFTPWVICYGGMLFDLLIVPALLWRRTRPAAFVLAVAFHLANAALFQIGVFPWFMILATVIFFPPGLPRALIGRPLPSIAATRQAERLTWPRRVGVATLAVYACLQLTVPLRHLTYSGDPNWTEQGHYFAWHMMLRGKRTAIRYYVTDPATKLTQTVDLRDYVSPFQVVRFGRDPLMIHQLAHAVARDRQRQGYPNVEVRVLALVSLNGRKPQLMIDPRVDLAAVPKGGGRLDWVVPLVEPLRVEAWNVPLDQWEAELNLPTQDATLQTGLP